MTAGPDDAGPTDNEMRFYARAFSAGKTPDELFARWQTYQAHAVLLAGVPDRLYSDYGLNGRQLSSGALIASRRMALLLAEEPTDIRQVLALKLHVVETMTPFEGQTPRSNALVMLDVALKADAERLGLLLPRAGAARGRTQ